MVPKVAALRCSVAPDLFTGFNVGTFPVSTLPALASVAAAYRLGEVLGEQFSLALRDALFEQGNDVSDRLVLAGLRASSGVGDPTPIDRDSVEADFRAGIERGVLGSPHFFRPDAAYVCPSLEIGSVDDELVVSFDEAGFQRFLTSAFA